MSLSVAVVSMGNGEDVNGMCSTELDPNKCDLSACRQECTQKYKGEGQCAHFGVQPHCICIYSCPWYEEIYREFCYC